MICYNCPEPDALIVIEQTQYRGNRVISRVHLAHLAKVLHARHTQRLWRPEVVCDAD